MSDPMQRLTTTQIADAGLADWRLMLGGIKARFRTQDFATGLRFVDRIGAAAEAADHHPDVTLTYPAVLVTLSSHDVRGVTSRDVDLARTISETAAELGVSADVSGLTEVQFGLDTTRGEENARYYAALLGAKVEDGEIDDPTGQTPRLWWQGPDDEGPDLPEPDVEQRWHLDVWVPIDEAQRRVAAVLDAGGRVVSDGAAPQWWVVEDVDGNRSCICTSADPAAS